MKSTVEQLTPTRVRINVEVPFTELKPDFERTYKELAKQVRVPGFRPGKAPAKLIEARFGRAAVLQQVVNEALPSRYTEAVTSSDLKPLGQPDIEVTKLEDGENIAFTAEVDVRPEITLPDLAQLKITVDPIEVDDAEVDAELDSLRARFGTLTGVDRPAAKGDFVSIDLDATIDGETVEGAATEGLSHEVGSGQLIEGLDDAIVGLSAGESKTFTTKLAAGPQAGKDAEVTVVVQSVKERELPEADDEFAQLASEYDTIGELRENLVEQVSRTKRIQQAEKVREVTLETLVELVEMPLPEAVVQAHIDNALHNALHGLDHDENKFAESLAEKGSSRAEFDAETRSEAEKSVKTQLLLDALADELEIKVGQNDLTQHLVLMARQYGVPPQQLIQFLQENKQLPAVLADVRRGMSLAAAVRAAEVTDTTGKEIDTAEFFGADSDDTDEADEAAEALAAAEEAAEAAEAAEAEASSDE
ncbi:trigger factor [Mycolicibacter arupensis]|uniref:Trigger factor n=1 Tax=Mycolicibacter arupensis TaxID=342002 RepID=A0A0F5N306_9MYCO|nr:trigger factor [Mycolicibacter arupensis]KKC01396.1 trigger factor [Mycolicibacter arupensis]MCV7276971.1 trigger factor [Mycolicibacter arupensis]ORA00897.1 trigger factor [Mycolicibacter arupensis]